MPSHCACRGCGAVYFLRLADQSDAAVRPVVDTLDRLAEEFGVNTPRAAAEKFDVILEFLQLGAPTPRNPMMSTS